MEYQTQTDPRYAGFKIPKSDNTIGKSGCLVTSLSNVYNTYQSAEVMTPVLLCIRLEEIGGFTTGGLVAWKQAEKVLNAKIEYDYKGKTDTAAGTFYIIHFENHFTNLLSDTGTDYLYFDVYSGKVKTINKNKVDRIIKIIIPSR